MKAMKIYEHKAIKLKRKPRFRMIRAGLAIAMAFGIGLYLGSATPWAKAETISAETARIHIVEPGETVWDIARPVADEQGIDVREIVYQLQINNDLDDDCTLTPGQKIVIRY